MAMKVWVHAKVDADQFARIMAIPELKDAPVDIEYRISFKGTEVTTTSEAELRAFLETMRPPKQQVSESEKP